MSHKTRKTATNINVEKALLNLKFPLTNNKGAKVFLKLSDSSHSRSKHISKQYHGLSSKDISFIPDALKDPFYVALDPNVKNNKNYYFRRAAEKKILFIKIITKIKSINEEEIITIFTTNKIKSRLKKKKKI